MRALRGLLAPLTAAFVGGAAAFLFQATAQTARGIESAPLTQLDGWGVGALTRAQGALPASLWAQSDPATLSVLFDRVPSVFDSPAALALARRALLSAGQAPRGDGVEDAMRKRFGALGRMGAADDLAMMAAGAGPAATDPAVAQYAAQAELARARRPDACLRGRTAGGDQPSTFLLRLRAYCAAAQGERAAADLALALVRSQTPDDAWFRTALGGVGDGAARPTVAARYDNSLNAAVSLAANLRAGANPLNGASTLALSTLARTETTPQPLRSQAALLALRRGALSPAQAKQILLAAPAEAAGLPPATAALRQARAEPGGLPAAAAVAEALRAAAAPTDFAAVAALLHDEIAALTTAPDAAAAVLFARAAIVTGDAPLAARLTQSAAAGGAAPASLGPLQTALSILSGESDAMAARRRIDQGGARAAARDVAILAALDAPLDSGARAFLIANPPSGGRAADSGLAAALASAADRGAVGEAALISAIITAPGPATLDAAALNTVLRALRAANLPAAARSLAIEAVLAGQPS